ncbi:MAG: hypothetical protein Q9191_004685 [Dirinaria sp. TL-2023a]
MTEEPESIAAHASTEPGQHLRRMSSAKEHRAKIGKRLSGRPAPNTSSSSLGSIDSLAKLAKLTSQDSDRADSEKEQNPPGHHARPQNIYHILGQVRQWLHEEKARRSARPHKTDEDSSKLASATNTAASLVGKIHNHAPLHRKAHHSRTSSNLSEGAQALEKLEQILAGGMDLDRDTSLENRKGSSSMARRASKRILRKYSTIGSSDTENRDDYEFVPCADVILDNSKTLSYTGGAAASESNPNGTSRRARREREACLQFNTEIVRLAHTLRLKGWRRVPLDHGRHIEVSRLSGAMTNAVYVVSPPKDLPTSSQDLQSSTTSVTPKKAPLKLLLRIYGPQAEHLIDREKELHILKRLARKKIGPRLLGTFINGRFEQFFNARTLTASDLRNSETSKQIAKRMRELHEGIELLDEERAAGPFVWQNWDKWVQRCEQIVTWLDKKIHEHEHTKSLSSLESWKTRGLVCGVPWPFFRQTVNRYRKWLEGQYRDPSRINQDMVFAHNDTQYGNLLRLQPCEESPLLTPANEHKQLVVIDFEYASANVPGLEFANHFQTEWCYNYHDTEKPYALKSDRYPTPNEQWRFLRAYVQHRPFQAQPQSPTVSAAPGPSSSISSFMLDGRAQSTRDTDEERLRLEAIEAEVTRLMSETRIWRIANSAQWVAWGIVQAKVVGMDEALDTNRDGSGISNPDTTTNPEGQKLTGAVGPDPLNSEAAPLKQDVDDKRPEASDVQGLVKSEEPPTEEEIEADFDYLGYAQERAMFFWGDVLQLGIVKKEDLPRELLGKVKIVEY